MILNKLAVLMEQNGVNQSQLADKTGLTRPTIVQLMTNENKNIRYESVNRLCKYFNIHMNELLLYSPIEIEFKEIIMNVEETIYYLDDYEDDLKQNILKKEDLWHEDNKGKYRITYHSEIYIKYFFDDELLTFIYNIDDIALFQDFPNKKLKCYLDLTLTTSEYDDLFSSGFTTEFLKIYNSTINLEEKIINEYRKHTNYIEFYNITPKNIDTQIIIDVDGTMTEEELLRELKALSNTQRNEIIRRIENNDFEYTKRNL